MFLPNPSATVIKYLRHRGTCYIHLGPFISSVDVFAHGRLLLLVFFSLFWSVTYDLYHLHCLCFKQLSFHCYLPHPMWGESICLMYLLAACLLLESISRTSTFPECYWNMETWRFWSTCCYLLTCFVNITHIQRGEIYHSLQIENCSYVCICGVIF